MNFFGKLIDKTKKKKYIPKIKKIDDETKNKLATEIKKLPIKFSKEIADKFFNGGIKINGEINFSLDSIPDKKFCQIEEVVYYYHSNYNCNY